MSDDWKPGDLALCVNRDPGPGKRWLYGCKLRRGGIYTVEAVWRSAQYGPLLTVREVPCTSNSGGFGTCRFRKINPLTDEERDAFLAELKELA